jgi:hypothetical protein
MFMFMFTIITSIFMFRQEKDPLRYEVWMNSHNIILRRERLLKREVRSTSIHVILYLYIIGLYKSYIISLYYI